MSLRIAFQVQSMTEHGKHGNRPSGQTVHSAEMKGIAAEDATRKAVTYLF